MPCVSRVSVMNRGGEELRVYVGPVHIKRWDNVVHIAQTGVPERFYVDAAGRIDSHFHARLVCGRGAKMHLFSRNRFTEEAATCLTCVVGGL
jgi:hypothetical protein